MAKSKRGFTFDYIDVRKPNYSKHNLSHDHLAAIGAGYIVPIWWTNAVPGDRFNMNLYSFVRLLALSSPMMQRQDIRVRAFKVPWRILADRKDLDIAYAGDKNGDHIDFPFLSWEYEDLNIGSLADYLGIPLPYEYVRQTKSWRKMDDDYIDTLPETNIFPVLAYHRIYHDHFRNEETENQWLDVFEQHYSDLDGIESQQSLSVYDQDAPAGVTFASLHKVGWERDYFTAALASSQRGSQVQIPLVGTAPVVPDVNIAPQLKISTPGAQENLPLYRDPSGSLQASADSETPIQWKKSGLIVDGSEFTGIGAIALRMAMNLQAFMERNNVAGYRMIGNILAHFGVRSSNTLHDEAEYLGGLSAPITVTAVNQTSATETNGTPQGTQVGTAQASFNGHLFSTYCEEPAVIMIVAYITSNSSYSQGLSRKWSIRNYLDLYWPEFQSVGEQEILNKELYFDFLHGQDHLNEGVWAYQSRYAEYKYEPDTIAGEFRTNLSYWHQSRLFTSLPAFNDDFIKANPSDRVFAVDTETNPRPYLCEFYFDCQAVRPMDKYAISRLW